MKNTSNVELIIYIVIGICVILAILVAIIMYLNWKKNRPEKKDLTPSDDESGKRKGVKGSESQLRMQGIESMAKFLDFDEVVDNMIARKNRSQYVMVLHCKGINFDLLGEAEKIAVESGFTQFLNTLRFPIQLYVQSRSINLNESINKYEQRVNLVKDDIAKIEQQIKKETANGNNEAVRKLEFEKKRKLNILEYGVDITNYVARLSQNRNVLQQNTYLAISYYTMESGVQLANYSKEEIDGLAFSELYTRAQTVIRALSSAGVSAKVMDSEELAELLYVAYNRDDSEIISVRRAIEAEYDSLYNTAKDLLEKQKEAIEEKIEQEAIDLTANSITKADKIIKLREINKEDIRRRALAYVEKYKGEMTKELYDETVKQVNKADLGDKEKEVKQFAHAEEGMNKAGAQNTERTQKASVAPKTREAQRATAVRRSGEEQRPRRVGTAGNEKAPARKTASNGEPEAKREAVRRTRPEGGETAQQPVRRKVKTAE